MENQKIKNNLQNGNENFFKNYENEKIKKNSHNHENQQIIQNPKKKSVKILSNNLNCSKIQIQTIKLKKNFISFLKDLFTHPKTLNPEKITNNLNNTENLILYYLIKRKLKLKNFIFPNQKLEKKNLKESINEYKQYFSNKRFEEIFKFTFKLFFNFKKTSFFKKNPFSKLEDDYFFAFYFKKISEQIKIPFYEFKDPLKNKKKNRLIKNFGKKYMMLIFKSEKFKKDYLKFLKNNLKEIYFKNLDRKIQNMIKKLFMILEKNKKKVFKEKQNFDLLSLYRKTVYDYFVKNNQCKIPWTIREIENSISKIWEISDVY